MRNTRASVFFDEGNFNNVTDMLDEFAKIKAIEFGCWLSSNCKMSNSKDGWYAYKDEWITTDECYCIFINSQYTDV